MDLGKSRGWTLVGDRRVSNGVRHGMQLKSVRVGYGLNISPSAADHKATDSARGEGRRAESRERTDAFGPGAIFGANPSVPFVRASASHVWEIGRWKRMNRPIAHI